MPAMLLSGNTRVSPARPASQNNQERADEVPVANFCSLSPESFLLQARCIST
jgi:hypothetical protein